MNKLADHKSRKNLITNILLAAILLSIIIIGTYFYWIIYDDNFNPPSDLYPTTYTYVVPKDETFTAKYYSQRFRNCYTETQRTITSEKTNSIVYKEVYKLTSDDFKKENVSTFREVSVKLPPNIPLGVYTYKSEVNYYCNPANSVFGPIKRTPVTLLFNVVDENQNYEWINYSDFNLQIEGVKK